MSTQQSQIGIGVGIAGMGLGTALATATASSENPEPGLIILGGLISLAGNIAALTGAGSLGPNRRLDELQMRGAFGVSTSDANFAPATPEVRPSPLSAEWFGFTDALRGQQNDFLLQRRSVQVIGGDPFVLVLEDEGCPESHVPLWRIVGNMTDGRMVVCRLMEVVGAEGG